MFFRLYLHQGFYCSTSLAVRLTNSLSTLRANQGNVPVGTALYLPKFSQSKQKVIVRSCQKKNSEFSLFGKYKILLSSKGKQVLAKNLYLKPRHLVFEFFPFVSSEMLRLFMLPICCVLRTPLCETHLPASSPCLAGMLQFITDVLGKGERSQVVNAAHKGGLLLPEKPQKYLHVKNGRGKLFAIHNFKKTKKGSCLQ